MAITRARVQRHGTLSVPSDTRMRIFKKETKSLTVAFVLHILTQK